MPPEIGLFSEEMVRYSTECRRMARMASALPPSASLRPQDDAISLRLSSSAAAALRLLLRLPPAGNLAYVVEAHR